MRRRGGGTGVLGCWGAGGGGAGEKDFQAS